MSGEKIKREYTPPMARVIGARMANGAKPPHAQGICIAGGNPHGSLCNVGSVFGIPPFNPPLTDHCNPSGAHAFLICASGGAAV
jgi:hypothetical protein